MGSNGTTPTNKQTNNKMPIQTSLLEEILLSREDVLTQ